MISKLRIAVLAAGHSRRMGRSKALLSVTGVSLLRRTLKVAAGLGSAPLLVVAPPAIARYRYEARGLSVRFVVNTRRAEGLAASVRCAVRDSRFSRGLLLIPVDLAALQRRDLQRLVHHWCGSPRRLAARRIGMHGGAPLLLPRHLYHRALEIHGDQGLKPLLESLAPRQRVLLDLPSAAFDVDTPADLAMARRMRRPANAASMKKS